MFRRLEAGLPSGVARKVVSVDSKPHSGLHVGDRAMPRLYDPSYQPSKIIQIQDITFGPVLAA